jgi:subtilisin family serine protease
MAWHRDQADCAKGVRVGLLGAGADIEHPAFKWKSVTLRRVWEDERAADWHGTAALSLLASQRASATIGLIPGAQFFVVDVFRRNAAGVATASLTAILQGLTQLYEHGVQVAALNIVGPNDPLLHDRIRWLSAKGMIFVAPVGDDGPHAPPSFPAAYPEVIAVTAVDRDLRVYSRANQAQHVDVAAPGVDIPAVHPGNEQANVSGTAFAATLVAAVVATLYFSVPHKTKDEVLQRMGLLRLEPGHGLGLAQAAASCQGRSEPSAALRR